MTVAQRRLHAVMGASMRPCCAARSWRRRARGWTRLRRNAACFGLSNPDTTLALTPPALRGAQLAAALLRLDAHHAGELPA